MLLGFVLGSLLEDNRRRALLISGGSQLHWGFWFHIMILLLSFSCRLINAFPTTREDYH